MSKINNISFSYLEFENPEELDANDRELINSAKDASLSAYAPYSKFNVGAAVRLASGRIVRGSNVENAAFPSGICAERNALSHSVSNYPNDRPVAIAIVAQTESGITPEPVSPCGNCRQVIAEEELKGGRNIRIILTGGNRTVVIESIAALLPMQFNSKDLRPVLP